MEGTMHLCHQKMLQCLKLVSFQNLENKDIYKRCFYILLFWKWPTIKIFFKDKFCDASFRMFSIIVKRSWAPTEIALCSINCNSSNTIFLKYLFPANIKISDFVQFQYRFLIFTKHEIFVLLCWRKLITLGMEHSVENTIIIKVIAACVWLKS